MPAAFVGEKDYRDLKHRFTKVAEFEPYRTLEAVILCMTCVLFLAGMLTLITRASYPKYVEDTDISLLNEAGEVFILYDSDTLKNAVYADGQNVYLDKTIFRDALQEHGIEKNTEYFWLGFGGYTKLPGIGGNINMVYVDYSGYETKLAIPYMNREEHFLEYIFKYILYTTLQVFNTTLQVFNKKCRMKHFSV